MLDRLRKALENKGIVGRGAAAKIAKDTGYSAATVSVAFNDPEKLTERFLRAVCNAYGINEEWVRTGEGEMLVKRPTMTIGAIDKAKIMEIMQQIVNSDGTKHEPYAVCAQCNTELEIDDQDKDEWDGGSERFWPCKVCNKPPMLVTTYSDGSPIIANTVIKPARTIPVITKAQGGDYTYWEDCYPVGEGLDRIDCPADITDPHAFAFLVEGDSMHPYAKHGNKVIVDTTKTPINNDEVVVKLADGRVMVKIYKKIDSYILLQSYNSSVEPIPVKPEDLLCCFVVVDVRK